MLCPKCKLENPEDAMLCDCGYNFETGMKERPIIIKGSDDYNKPKTNGWTTGLKILGWVSFILWIIGGIVISSRYFYNENVLLGILIVVTTFVIAFSSTAVIMIYIGIAEDINAIRNHM